MTAVRATGWTRLTRTWSRRVARWRRSWEARSRRYSVPEVVSGLVLVVAAALAATLSTGSPLAMGLAVVVGTVLHLAAVDTGSHSLGWLASGLVLAFALIGGDRLFDGLSPIAYTVPPIVALGHNELLSLGHARRRSGLVDQTVPVSSATGLAATSVIAVFAVGLAQRLGAGTDRSWLWLALAAALVATAAILLMWIPARRPNPARRKRWRPGERLPPVPLSELQIDDPTQLGRDPADGTLV